MIYISLLGYYTRPDVYFKLEHSNYQEIIGTIDKQSEVYSNGFNILSRKK